MRVRGGLEEEIHVLLDEEELRRTGLSIQTVIERLAQENINLAGGTLTEGRTEYMVRTLNEYENLQQIADTIVARFEGRDVRVSSIGRVVRAHKEREILTRTDAQRERPDRHLQGGRRQHRGAGQAGQDGAGRVRPRGGEARRGGGGARG